MFCFRLAREFKLDPFEVLRWPMNKIWKCQAFLLADSEKFQEGVQQENAQSKGTDIVAVQRMLTNLVEKK